MTSMAAVPRPQVTVAISGGLGNQMFQYAAGRSLAGRTDGELCLDLTFYDRGRHRSFELNQFPIRAGCFGHAQGRGALRRFISQIVQALVWARTRRYREPHFHYDSAFETLTSPIRIQGYFQSERYFAAHAGVIRRELMPPQPGDSESLNYASALKQSNATALHVRRGDYVSNAKAKAMFAALSPEYYAKAMRAIPGDGPVYVFSDDREWARANLPPIKPLVFVGRDTPRPGIADLWLMTLARNHIIANSSFSWWGAWLAGAGNEKKGLTIAPARWFNDDRIQNSDLVPSDWLRVS